MTKKQVIQIYQEEILPTIKAIENGTPDKVARREEWNNYTDMLCKQGDITEEQYNNWIMPEYLLK